MPQGANTLILVALMVVAFYFLILRPQKKRQQAVQQTMNRLTPGTRVLLGSGIFATVTSVGTKQAVVEVSPGTEITILKQAIARVATDADEDGLEDTEELDEPDEPATPVLDSDYAREIPVEPAHTRSTAVEPDFSRDALDPNSERKTS